MLDAALQRWRAGALTKSKESYRQFQMWLLLPRAFDILTTVPSSDSFLRCIGQVLVPCSYHHKTPESNT